MAGAADKRDGLSRGRSTAAAVRGDGIAHGSFGELLQGALPGIDNNFLITLPIVRFSRACFQPSLDRRGLKVFPDTKWKALRIARKTLDHFGSSLGGTLTLHSDLPEGKGMSSSSADLVAVIVAILQALDQPISTELIMSLLRGIEPSDGVMYCDTVVFLHRKVQLYRRLGYLPPLRVVAIDEGGQVDTIAYNRRHRGFSAPEITEYERLLAQAIEAFERGDWKALGRISTRSAVLNQERNPKRYLDRMIEIGERFGALGVVATHSGPCLGLLFAPDEDGPAARLPEAVEALRGLDLNVLQMETLSSTFMGAVREVWHLSPETLDLGHGVRAVPADPAGSKATLNRRQQYGS
ncbi:MAG TPA: kinase [Thermoanaerobaculia bacterium]|jgi:L-threonine kinase